MQTCHFIFVVIQGWPFVIGLAEISTIVSLLRPWLWGIFLGPPFISCTTRRNTAKYVDVNKLFVSMLQKAQWLGVIGFQHWCFWREKPGKRWDKKLWTSNIFFPLLWSWRRGRAMAIKQYCVKTAICMYYGSKRKCQLLVAFSGCWGYNCSCVVHAIDVLTILQNHCGGVGGGHLWPMTSGKIRIGIT